MIRRLLAPVLLLPLALVPHAGAASTGASDAAFLAMDLTVAGHVYRVDLLAARPTALGTGTADEVRLQVTDDDGFLKYAAALPAGVLALSADAAELTTVVGGLPLHVQWSTNGGFGSGGDGETLAVDTEAPGAPDLGYYATGSSAIAEVALGSTRCTLSVFALVGTAVSGAAATAEPTTEAFDGLDLSDATCADLDAYEVG